MHPRAVHAAVAVLLALSGTALAQPEHLDPDGGANACGKGLLARFNAGLNPDGSRPDDGVFGPREAMTDTDVLHNNLDVEFIPGPNTITGSNTMTIRSLVPNLTEFTFALRNNFTISQVLFNGATALPAPAFVGTYLQRVALPRPVALNETFTLRIAYSGPAVSRGFGSIEFTSLNGSPGVFTLSEPYYAATWWPCKDGEVSSPGDNADKATLDIAVTVPTAMTVASNGLLQGIDTLSGSRRRHRWHSDYPIASYLVCVGATTFTSWSSSYSYPLPGGGTGSMPLQFFVHPASDSPAQRAAWERSAEMMAAFRAPYGEYPFVNEKYGIYQFTFGGGMEHQTMTGQAASTSESLTSHELAHQWWGDNVTCRTWGDIWLNEGFATYSECIWAERKPGSAGTPALLAAIAGRRPGNTSSGSVYRYDVSSANSIFSGTFAYNKGAWVLHGLRKTLGDAAFFDLLHAYRDRFQGSAATTDDFAGVASEIAGRDMLPFFDAWVMGEGSPSFVSSFQKVAVNGRDYLKLRVRQNQPAPAPAFFPCGLDVRATAAGGTQNAFVLAGAASSWHIIPLSVSGAVSSVTLDPDDWILNQGKASEPYTQGPPKLLTAAPAPASSFTPATAPASIDLGFSDTIAATPAHFALTRNGSPVPFSYSYNPATFVATLTPAAPLAPGAYTVTVSDAVSANGGLRLDGEISAAALPSGDGAPGGNASFAFSISAPPCPADFNNDGFLDFFDYDDFVNCFQSGACPPGSSADFNNDGFADFFDYDDFVAAFESGC